jgi:hypothetical protein
MEECESKCCGASEVLDMRCAAEPHPTFTKTKVLDFRLSQYALNLDEENSTLLRAGS